METAYCKFRAGQGNSICQGLVPGRRRVNF